MLSGSLLQSCFFKRALEPPHFMATPCRVGLDCRFSPSTIIAFQFHCTNIGDHTSLPFAFSTGLLKEVVFFICLYCQEEPPPWDLNWLMVTNGVTITLALKYCQKDVQGARVNKALQPWNHFSYFGKFCDLEWDGEENHKPQCWGPPRFLVCAVTFLQVGTKYSYTHRCWLWDRVGRKSGRAVK